MTATAAQAAQRAFEHLGHPLAVHAQNVRETKDARVGVGHDGEHPGESKEEKG